MTQIDLYKDWNTYLSKTGVVLNPYQEQAARELLNLPMMANLTWCRDSGKTFLMGNLAFFLMYRLGWRIVISAPILGQASHIMYEAGQAAWRTCIPSKVHVSSLSISIKGRQGRIISVTGSVDANKQGEKGHIIMIDEKQDVIGTQAAEDFIGMKIKGGCLWLVGIGGSPDSAGEMFRDEKTYISSLGWQEYSSYDMDYIVEKVEPARKWMLPEEFSAHYECKPLDMTAHLLIPRLEQGILIGKARSVVGIDWGENVDHTVATLTHHTGNEIYIDQWLRPVGGYPQQVKELANWLNDEVEWDEIYTESNGCGKVGQFLQTLIPKAKSINVDQRWITEQARKLHALSTEGKLYYNPDHPLSGVFVKELSGLKYKMTSSKNISLPHSGERGHSDVISSLMLCMESPKTIYL